MTVILDLKSIIPNGKCLNSTVEDKSKQLDELSDFVSVMEEKIVAAGKANEECFVGVFFKIKEDIAKIIHGFETSIVTFQEAYSEITSLYVFTEMYLRVGNKEESPA